MGKGPEQTLILRGHADRHEKMFEVTNQQGMQMKTQCCQGCGEKGTVVRYWWECRLVQPLWKTVQRFLKKLKLELSYDLVIPLLCMYLKKPNH